MTNSLLGRHIASSAIAELGPVTERRDIKSSLGPFRVLQGYKIRYPAAVIGALGQLYQEFNLAFAPLIMKNREWPPDYQYCFERDGTPINYAVQIDIVGLPQSFLDSAEAMTASEVRELLRGWIFEIENSLAMYQLLQRAFASNSQSSFFDQRFRSALARIRARFGKPLALLAVTDQKHAGMRESEFGNMNGEPLSDGEILELSGFDRLFSPAEFITHIKENEGGCQYLLYARTSDPVAVLRKPGLKVEHPLLSDPTIRRIIKANTLTLNIDDPGMGHDRRINDTKEYMPALGMGFPLCSSNNNLFFSPELSEHLSLGNAYADFRGNRFSEDFAVYLQSRGIDPKTVEAGEVRLRAKPMRGTYGGYGHLVGCVADSEFRKEVRAGMRQRGDYIIQPEMPTPYLTNTTDGTKYTYIDRVFFSALDGETCFLGGFRTLLPTESSEAKHNRVHGNVDAVMAEIAS